MFRPPLSPYLLRAPIPSALPFFAKFIGNPATPPPLAAAAASAGPVKFAFSYGVAFAGKPRRRGEQIPRGLAGGGEKGSWRSAMLAWGKERDAGEDFFMLREGEESQPSVVAVADGVGGWAESGVDPSAFSQALMFYAWKAAQTDAHRSPSELLQQAYDGTMKESEVRAGSATACVLSLDPTNGLLKSANLGDSGFAVIRNGRTFIDVPEAQQHYFNCPRQLAKVPHRRGYETNISDQPKDADLFDVQLQDGDIVLCFTDGLGDNIHPQELLLLLDQVKVMTPPPSPTPGQEPSSGSNTPDLSTTYADALLRYGRICMGSMTKESPFQVAAAKEGLDFRGGKVDDFTVVVVEVKAL